MRGQRRGAGKWKGRQECKKYEGYTWVLKNKCSEKKVIYTIV